MGNTCCAHSPAAIDPPQKSTHTERWLADEIVIASNNPSRLSSVRLFHVFLSHVKREASATARLFQILLERVLREKGIAHPKVFLDSDNLVCLQEVKKHVQESSNLVVLLTKSYISSQWCQLEICAAIASGVNIVPVKVEDAADRNFDFQEAQNYVANLSVHNMDRAHLDFLNKNNISLLQLKCNLEYLLGLIVKPFHVQLAQEVQLTELSLIVGACNLQTPSVSHDPVPAAVMTGFDLPRGMLAVMAGFDLPRASQTGSFVFTKNNLCACFPNPSGLDALLGGPNTLFSDTTCTLKCQQSLQWKFVVKGNSSWCAGVVPIDQLDKQDYLFKEAKFGMSSLGLHGGVLEGLEVHKQVLQLSVNPTTKQMVLSISGLEAKVWDLPSEIFPLKLGICGFNATKINLITEEEDVASLLEDSAREEGPEDTDTTLLELLRMLVTRQVQEAEEEEDPEVIINVRIRVKLAAEVEQLQKGHGGYSADMEKALGMTGHLLKVDKDGDMFVRLTSGPRLGAKYCWNPRMVEIDAGALSIGSEVMLVAGTIPGGCMGQGDVGTITEKTEDGNFYRISVSTGPQKGESGLYSKDVVCPIWQGADKNQDGRKVRIKAVTVAEAQQLQVDHGGWCPTMERCLGKRGTLISVTRSHFKVRTEDGESFAWAHSMVEFEEAPQLRFAVGAYVVLKEEEAAEEDGVLGKGEIGVVEEKNANSLCYIVVNWHKATRGSYPEHKLRLAESHEVSSSVSSKADIKVGRFYKLASCASPRVGEFSVGDAVMVDSTSAEGRYDIEICTQRSETQLKRGYCEWHHLETLVITYAEPEAEFQEAEEDTELQSPLNENQLCCSCLEKPKTVAVLPCGHLCLCVRCAKSVTKMCPICRAEIRSLTKIFT